MAEDEFRIKHLAPGDVEYENSMEIKVTSYKGQGCEGCFEVSYFGPLYKGCSATGSCMPQRYQVVLDKNGLIMNNKETQSSTQNGLKKYDPTARGLHSSLSEIEFLRLITLANSNKDIEDIYGITATQKDSYAGKISKAKETTAHGNTAATFITHITMARRELLKQKKITGDWADYSGVYPGYEAFKKGEHTNPESENSPKIINSNLLQKASDPKVPVFFNPGKER
jgi:hypothetical protein